MYRNFHFKYLLHNKMHYCHSERSEEYLVPKLNTLCKINETLVKRFFSRSSFRMTCLAC